MNPFRSVSACCLLASAILFVIVGTSIVFNFGISRLIYILAMAFFALGICFRKN